MTKILKNVKIGTRLIITFSIVGILFIIAMIISIYNLSVVSGKLESFYNSPFSVVSNSWEARRCLIAIERDIYEALSTFDHQQTQTALNNADTEITRLNAIFTNLEQIYLGDKTLITQAKNELAETDKYKQDVYKFTSENTSSSNTKALEIFKGNYLPELQKVADSLLKISADSTNRAKSFVTEAQSTKQTVLISLLLLGFLSLVSIIILSIIITRSILKPLNEIEFAVTEVSKGNLEVELCYKSEDELGKLSHSTRETIRELRKYINNVSITLEALAHKDMSVTVDIDYLGSFKPIKESMLTIISSFNNMIYQIKESATQVSAGSGNIATASQALATGATEQSSAVEELVATIHEVTEHVNMNAKNADNVNDISTNSVLEIEKGNNYMQNLLKAMNDITTQSQEIANIIKVIDSISTQTNLLSLNASIEAARAGEHGAGFAVVADEIGKLANECGEAAKNTAELISNSISVVSEGSKLADETAEVLKTVVNSSSKTSSLVEQISIACNQQATSLNEVLQGVQQIAVVVESNSATAEETSASSEELLSQAEILTGMLSEFKLN